jgi:5-methylcytosine-specific restriction endonuclease McrA
MISKMEQGKTCKQCREWKEFEHFYKQNTNNDGYMGKCKNCIIIKTRQYHAENKEKISLQKKQYRKENKEKLSIIAKQYRKENKEKVEAKEKRSREKNREKISARQRLKYEKNKEVYSIRHKQYYEKNRENLLVKSKQYREENREKISARFKIYREKESFRQHRYRSHLKRKSHKYKVKFTPFQRKQIIDRDKWKCQLCGIKVHDRSTGNWNTPDKAHIDHIIPITKGGNSEPSNLQTLCRTCNLSKRDKVEQQLSLF